MNTQLGLPQLFIQRTLALSGLSAYHRYEVIIGHEKPAINCIQTFSIV